MAKLWASLVAGALSLVAVSVSAQTSNCSDVMASMRVPMLPDGETGDGPFGCSFAQVQMLDSNQIAMSEATGVEDITTIYGTWLGDDVLPYMMGVTTPGQEVLRISAGPDGMLSISQFWFRASLPQQADALVWDEAGQYQGRVMTGMFEPLDASGAWQVSPVGGGSFATYDGLMLEFSRAEYLHAMQRVNHFDLPVTFRLAQDVLVLEGQQFEMPARQAYERIRTYSRVSEGAPDLAMRIVKVTEVSAAANFDCIAHQISDEKGKFIDAMAPFSVNEIDRVVTKLFLTSRQREALAQQVVALGKLPENFAEQNKAFMTSYLELTADPVFTQLKAVMNDPSLNGCISF